MAQQEPIWRLSDILKKKDIPEIMKEIRVRSDNLAREKKFFSPGMSEKRFNRIMNELEIIERALSKLGSYAGNWYNENTKNQEAAAIKQEVSALSAEVENKLLFISQEWKRFDRKNASRLMKNSDYKYHLLQTRRAKKYTLSDAEEHIINIKDLNGSNALTTVYSMITTSFTYKVRGREVSVSELIKMTRSPDRSLRKEAYDALMSKYADNKEVLGEIYKHIVDDWRREARIRRYHSPISVRNFMNDIPDEAVETLLSVVRKNFPLFQRFFRKKAKLLGIKKLSRYDIYAPLKKSKTKYSWDDAVGVVKDLFKGFHDEFFKGAELIIKSNHIHARVQLNKYTGAYCSYPSSKTVPYILLNFNHDLLSLGTLTHELGHGIHGILASNNNEFHFHAPLPICETASIFSEMLLGDYLRKKNPNQAKELALYELDDLYASIIRQVGFVLFEKEAHEMEGATIDELSDVYMKTLKEQFGRAVAVDDNFRYEWLYIPHIYHTPFYCYSYAFGALLSLAFYAQYLKDSRFADKVVLFLKKGGSESPEKLIKSTGFDIRDPAFWQSGFDVIKSMINSL